MIIMIIFAVIVVLTYGFQTAVDTLLMRFTTSIHDSAYSVVSDYAKVRKIVCEVKHRQQFSFFLLFFSLFVCFTDCGYNRDE